MTAHTVGSSGLLPLGRLLALRRPVRHGALAGAWSATAVRMLGQTAVLTGAAAAYFSVRSLTEGDRGAAVSNAEQVVALERVLGLNVEPALQAAVLPYDALVLLANWVYVFGRWPVIIGVLGWLAVRHPVRFAELRGALLLSGAVGMLVFAVLPVAPPRLLDEGDVAGMVDTVLQHSQAYRMLQPPAFTNQYAAVPSLHVGWDLLAGIAIATTAQRRWVRTASALLPVLMVLAVLVTANHYVVDAVAGAALALVSLAAVRHRAWRRAAAGAGPSGGRPSDRSGFTAPAEERAAAGRRLRCAGQPSASSASTRRGASRCRTRNASTLPDTGAGPAATHPSAAR